MALKGGKQWLTNEFDRKVPRAGALSGSSNPKEVEVSERGKGVESALERLQPGCKSKKVGGTQGSYPVYLWLERKG